MEKLRADSRIIHPEVQAISREQIQESLARAKITLPYYSKYEYVALIGTRAQQLAEGARPLVSLEGLVPSEPTFVWKVAEREIEQKRLFFIIHRRIPNGQSEYWSAADLSVVW
jgi:DNA-directed RNA polymerase I, II, and III subunit RPABC2